MSKSFPRATPEEINQLDQADSLKTIEILRARGWIAAEVPELNAFFANEPHPARALLTGAARTGGKYGLLQAFIFLGLLLLTILVTSVNGLNDVVTYAFWVSLGAYAGLLHQSHPRLINRFFKR